MFDNSTCRRKYMSTAEPLTVAYVKFSIGFRSCQEEEENNLKEILQNLRILDVYKRTLLPFSFVNLPSSLRRGVHSMTTHSILASSRIGKMCDVPRKRLGRTQKLTLGSLIPVRLVWGLSKTRKAAKLAVYEATMIIAKPAHTIPRTRAEKLRGVPEKYIFGNHEYKIAYLWVKYDVVENSSRISHLLLAIIFQQQSSPHRRLTFSNAGVE